MSIQIHPYNHNQDFQRVSDFLTTAYRPGRKLANWLQPRWEYMHYVYEIPEADLVKIGLFEEGGEIVGMVHFESCPGYVYFQVHPDYLSLKEDMLTYAEEHLCGETENGGRFLELFINDFDHEFEALASQCGYTKSDESVEEMSRLELGNFQPEIGLPNGYSLKSLADENDFRKINRVLWRGFNHPGPPPEEHIEGRRTMQQAPNFRKELTIVAVAPDGNFVSYCGMWYDARHHYAYVEPVATDPDYRRMGLGKVAVLESLRRVKDLGATVAWVGSGQVFYESMGFRRAYNTYAWRKSLTGHGF